MTAPQITPQTFPYQRKWTRAQLDEILARKDALSEAMADAVGPTGQIIYMPDDLRHILALHLALAGGTVRDELAYIKARIRPNEPGMFADTREWLLKSEYVPAPPDPDETAVKARAAADQIRRQLTPEVRAAVMAMMADELKHATRNDAE
jgi:hypothetical protein